MKIKVLSGLVLLAGATLLNTGCKKYLDVNTNPNVAQDVPVDQLLPSSQISMASALGVDLQVNGSIWSQYWTQAPSSSQYKIFEQYSPSASTYDRVWGLLYSSSLEDLDRIEKKATASNQSQYVGLAKILKAYEFQVVTDGWGDIPFSEALKGLPEDGANTAPKFDAQAAVYDGIIKMVQDGRTLLEGSGSDQAISGDLVYGGDKDLWIKFANTLELKMFLRLSEKNPTKAQTGATAIMTSAGANGFIDEGEDAIINYGSAAGNQNPLYAEMVGLQSVQNLVASATSVDSMNSNNDYRLFVFYNYLSNGSFAGLAQGFYTASASTSVSIPNHAVGADVRNDASALAPVKFITSYESKFLQAEAAARGWGGAGTDAALYDQGIHASFAAYSSNFAEQELLLADVGDVSANGNPITAPILLSADYGYYAYTQGDTLYGVDPAYWSQYPTAGSVQDKLRFIITQKWFSMNGNQGFEAWTEWRRTGYPDFFTISVNSIIGNKFPRALFYPDVEVQRNRSFPGQRLITDKVWWDIH